MLLLLQGKSRTELGGLLSLAILTDACSLRNSTLKILPNFDRTPNGTFQIR